MNTAEVNSLKRNGYHPRVFYDNNPVIRRALDEMNRGFQGVSFSNIFNSLTRTDPYMVLADFDSYAKAQRRAVELYADQRLWNRMGLMNIANAGRFAADRAIRDYARDIWNATPTP